jgi:endonuclease YncB( thermonuclease family)
MGKGLDVDLSSALALEEEAPQGPQVNPLAIEGTTLSFLDGDTLKDSDTGQSIRLRGMDSRETAKILNGKTKAGEAGGDAATAYNWSLAQKGGFNKVVLSGETDIYGRAIGDLQDKDGHSFADTLIRTGVSQLTKYSTDEDVSMSLYGMAADASEGATKSAYDEAREAIYKSETDQYGGLPMQKLLAFDAAEYNANPDLYMSIKTRNQGADYEGLSRTPFGTGLETGMATLYKSLNTLGQALSNRIGADEMEASFAADAQANQQYSASRPTVQMDVTEINWKSFDEVTDGMMGMLGTSIPFMGATMVGMAATPVTYGASMALPVAMYTGMTLDGMEGNIEDKNLGVAIAAGAAMSYLDKIGLKGLVSPKMMITKEGRAEAIKAIAKQEGLTTAQASKKLLDLTKRDVLKYVDDAKAFGAAQIQKGHLFREGVKNLARSGTGEGVTEAMQELTEYTAAVIGSEKEWDYDEIQNRMTNAIVAGGLMGAGFSAPSSVTQGMGWNVATDPLGAEDTRFDNINTAVRKAEEAEHGFVMSIDNITEENATRETEGAKLENGQRYRESDPLHVEERAAKHTPPGTTIEHVKAFMYNPMVALRGTWANTVYKAGGKSKTLTKMYDMIGSTRHRVFGGTNMVQAQQLKMAEYDTILRDQEVIESSFDTPSRLSAAGRSEYVSNLTKKFYKEVLLPADKSGTELNWDNASPEVTANKAALLALDKELNTLSDTMLNDNNKAKQHDNESKTQRLANWAYRHKGFRKEQIQSNKPQFIALLQSEYGMDMSTASSITEAILDNESVSTLGEAFDVTKGGVSPGSMKARKLHISDRPAFDNFVEQNIFKNMGDASRESSRLQAHRKYIGKDSKYINRMLADTHNELLETMDPESAEKLLNEISYDITNILNAESGNYKQIQNQTIKQGQKYLTLLTTLQGLANAAFSSIPEMAMIPYGVPRDVLIKNSATQGYLFGSAVGAWMRNIMSTARLAEPRPSMETFLDKRIAEVRSKGDKDPRFMFYTNMKDMLKQTGFKSQETGAATTTGVQETNELTKGVTDAFFKANFLHDQQDMHRMMRLSFFNDFLIDKLDLIESKVGQPDTVGVAEAKNMLRELGIPLSVIQPLANKLKKGEALTDAEAAKYKREFLNGAANFVNQAIPLPNAFNRPLFYSDPRFALLTQFNGFTSTFTANQLPMLWDQLKGKGTRGMSYSTFAAMGSMVALAFISQGMKDELKYGESSPYLTDSQKVQRAIYSSGLMGTTERVIGSNFILPLYEQGSNGPTGFIWDNVAGEAAATGTVERAFSMVSAGFEGDTAKFEKNFWGSMLFFGPYKHRIINYNWD